MSKVCDMINKNQHFKNRTRGNREGGSIEEVISSPPGRATSYRCCVVVAVARYDNYRTAHALSRTQEEAPLQPMHMHLQGILVQDPKHMPGELARTLRDVVFAAVERLRVHHLEPGRRVHHSRARTRLTCCSKIVSMCFSIRSAVGLEKGKRPQGGRKSTKVEYRITLSFVALYIITGRLEDSLCNSWFFGVETKNEAGTDMCV